MKFNSKFKTKKSRIKPSKQDYGCKISGLLFLIGIFAAVMAFSVISVKDNLLLIDIDIRDDDGKILPGETITIDTDIILDQENHDDIVDITITYTIKDKEGNIQTTLTETKGAILRLKLIPKIIIPYATLPGIYVIEVEAYYSDESAASHHLRKSSLQFEVIDIDNTINERIKNSKNIINFLTLAFTGMSLLILMLLYYKQRKFNRLELLLKKQTKQNQEKRKNHER